MLRECHTIAVALDHLALGRAKAAADTLGQRLKAIELAGGEGGWERAQKIELVGPESTFLAEKEEQLGATRDMLLDRKLSGTRGSSKPWWHAPRPQKGKGKSDKGKGDPWSTEAPKVADAKGKGKKK